VNETHIQIASANHKTTKKKGTN